MIKRRNIFQIVAVGLMSLYYASDAARDEQEVRIYYGGGGESVMAQTDADGNLVCEVPVGSVNVPVVIDMVRQKMVDEVLPVGDKLMKFSLVVEEDPLKEDIIHRIMKTELEWDKDGDPFQMLANIRHVNRCFDKLLTSKCNHPLLSFIAALRKVAKNPELGEYCLKYDDVAKVIDRGIKDDAVEVFKEILKHSDHDVIGPGLSNRNLMISLFPQLFIPCMQLCESEGQLMQLFYSIRDYKDDSDRDPSIIDVYEHALKCPLSSAFGKSNPFDFPSHRLLFELRDHHKLSLRAIGEMYPIIVEPILSKLPEDVSATIRQNLERVKGLEVDEAKKNS